jgi:BRCT domain type II-containing protein
MIDASHFGTIATPARMQPTDAYRHLDDPDELAELTRELPARADGATDAEKATRRAGEAYERFVAAGSEPGPS